MKRKSPLLLSMATIAIFSFTSLKSQSLVHGSIMTAKGDLLPFANVTLLRSTDSALIKMIMSGSDGKYVFEQVEVGNYLVSASFTGMTQVYSEAFEITSNTKEIIPGILYMKDADAALKTVTVSARKNTYEEKMDRTVINVKNSITDAGGTALDILQKAPGVTVNRQNNSISINGKNGVDVLINGKKTYMPADALLQFLASTNAGNIEKIELITTPSSKYDAEGNAGFINILFVDNPNIGFNGSYFLSAGYGQRERASLGANFNYRSQKINLYGNYSFDHDHVLQASTGLTAYSRGLDQIENTSFSDRDAWTEVHNLRMGIDIQLDTATIIGVLVSGYNRHWSMDANNGVTISKNNHVDTTITSFSQELNIWSNLMGNVNFRHNFNSGAVIFSDINYVYYENNNPTTYSNNYYDHLKSLLFHEDLRSTKITPINFLVMSADYASPFGKKILFETGAKMSFARFTNDAGVAKLEQGIWIPDDHFSANYQLKESIGAAYATMTLNLEHGLTLKGGLRYEYTASNLGSKENPNIVDRKYGELFPTFYLSKKLPDNNSFNFAYSRRITRPAFTDLAPFLIFFDPKTFFSGNPGLQPAIANTIKGGFGFKRFIFSLSYTVEQNTIENFYFQTQKIDTLTNVVYLSASNFKSEHYFTTALSLPIRINNWWNLENNINLNWRSIQTADTKPAAYYRFFDYHVNISQRFTLPRNYSMELTAIYSSPSYLGTSKFDPMYQVDIGVQKSFNNRNDLLRFAGNDIFNSAGDYRLTDQKLIAGATVKRDFNLGLVSYKLTYTHNFGNQSLKAKRERSTGAEDELKRVNN